MIKLMKMFNFLGKMMKKTKKILIAKSKRCRKKRVKRKMNP